MIDRPHDPRWPKLLSLSVHEFRTPMTVVAGYIRMLLKERAGPLSEQQRRLLEEAEKSCARLSALLAEMSDLGALEGGKATFSRSELDLPALLQDAIAGMPEVPDRHIPVILQPPAAGPRVLGDRTRLHAALGAVLHALRREVVTSPELCVRLALRPLNGRQVAWLAIADAEHIEATAAAAPEQLTTFDEWRGGVGLSLAVARRVINAHDGSIWSPRDGTKTAAVVALPVS